MTLTDPIKRPYPAWLIKRLLLKKIALTVRWLAGDFTCRILSFFRIFGLYLSSNIIICISLDRLYAIVWPLKANTKASKNTRIFLWTAWIISFLSALPQVRIGIFLWILSFLSSFEKKTLHTTDVLQKILWTSIFWAEIWCLKSRNSCIGHVTISVTF